MAKLSLFENRMSTRAGRERELLRNQREVEKREKKEREKAEREKGKGFWYSVTVEKPVQIEGGKAEEKRETKSESKPLKKKKDTHGFHATPLYYEDAQKKAESRAFGKRARNALARQELAEAKSNEQEEKLKARKEAVKKAKQEEKLKKAEAKYFPSKDVRIRKGVKSVFNKRAKRKGHGGIRIL